MTVHADLYARHRAVLPDWVALYYDEPIELVRGEGRRVWDGQGNSYLDMFGGILTTMLGHAVPEVVTAVQQQAERMLHTSTLYLNRPMVELAEEVAAKAPFPDAKVFFTTSGSEANELAMLLACTARASNQVLALRNSYHGRSYATMGVTGNRSWSASSLSPVNVNYVHGGYRYRSPWQEADDAAYMDACVDDLRSVIETATAGDVACMIVEPVQGVGGFTHPPDGTFAAMKQVLDEYGIILISDEVQTGWGRTGDTFWGIEAHEIAPDIMTFAKGIGNGLSMGGVVAPAGLMDSVNANSISTFGGNPLSAAGALATLRYLNEHDIQANVRKVSAQLREPLGALSEQLPAIGEVRGKGLMIGVDFVDPGTTKPAPQTAAAALEAARRRGILIGTGGRYGNVLRIAPPLTLTTEEASEAVAGITDAIEEAAAV